MSDLEVSPPQPYAPPPAGPPVDESSSDIPLWVVLVVGGVVLALAAALAVFVIRGLVPDKAAAPSYPALWDTRIAKYAKIAEKQRDLDFVHPVEVRFLPAAEFEKTVTADKQELSSEDRTELEHFTGLMRAFGLITGDLDLFDAVNDVRGGGILAYYSFDDQTITIRGERLTPEVRSTLVHELTHALQDQHFDVGDRMRTLRAEDGVSTSEASVLEAIIEGDAQRVQGLYRDSLSAKKRKALDAGRQDEDTQAGGRLSKVPTVILTMIGSPYTLGAALVQAVAADGGSSAVDKLFTDAPTHESALLDPFQAMRGDTGARKVETPPLNEGEEKFDSGELGVLMWYFMLAERLPLLDALAAADGWGGDSFVAFERDGGSCARMTYAGDTPGDTTRMLSALHRWIAAAPGSPAKVRRDGDVVRFVSCDPSKAAKVGKDASQDAVALLTTRTYLGIGLLRSGASEKTAGCLAGRLVREYPAARLVDPRFGADDAAVQARVKKLAAGCA